LTRPVLRHHHHHENHERYVWLFTLSSVIWQTMILILSQ